MEGHGPCGRVVHGPELGTSSSGMRHFFPIRVIVNIDVMHCHALIALIRNDYAMSCQ